MSQPESASDPTGEASGEEKASKEGMKELSNPTGEAAEEENECTENIRDLSNPTGEAAEEEKACTDDKKGLSNPTGEASGEDVGIESKENRSSGRQVDEDRDIDEGPVSVLKPPKQTAGGKVSKSVESSPKKVKYADEIATFVELPSKEKYSDSYGAALDDSSYEKEKDGNLVSKAVELPPEDTGFLLLSKGACGDDGRGAMVREKCISCKEFLRGHCVLCHSKEPPSIGPYNSPRRSISRSTSQTSEGSLPETCKEHETESADIFCRDHCLLICNLCLRNGHNNCVTSTLSEIETEAASNKDFRAVETQLSELMLEVEARKKLAAKKVESLKRYRDKVVASIHDIRNKLAAHLDRLEETIIHEANEYMNEDLRNIQTIQSSYGSTLYDLKVAYGELQNKAESEHGFPVFIAVKNARSQYKHHQEVLDGEKFDGRLRFHDFEPDIDLTSLILKKESLGTLIVQHTDITEDEHCSINIRKESMDEEKKFTEIDVRTQENDMKCCINDILPLDNGNLILVDIENTSIKYLDVQTNSIVEEISLTSIPSSVTTWGDKELIVTLPAAAHILSIETNTDGKPIRINNRYKVSKGCHGIARVDGGLVVAFQNPDWDTPGQVQVITHRGDTIFTLPDPPIQYTFDMPTKVAVDIAESNVFIVDTKNSKVISMLNDLDECLEYKHDDMIHPSGVTIGPDKNLLVCGSVSNNVQRISPTCKLLDTPLTETDGVCSPYSIAYSKADDKLYIGSYNDNIRVFHLNLLNKGEEEQSDVFDDASGNIACEP